MKPSVVGSGPIRIPGKSCSNRYLGQRWRHLTHFFCIYSFAFAGHVLRLEFQLPLSRETCHCFCRIIKWKVSVCFFKHSWQTVENSWLQRIKVIFTFIGDLVNNSKSRRKQRKDGRCCLFLPGQTDFKEDAKLAGGSLQLQISVTVTPPRTSSLPSSFKFLSKFKKKNQHAMTEATFYFCLLLLNLLTNSSTNKEKSLVEVVSWYGDGGGSQIRTSVQHWGQVILNQIMTLMLLVHDTENIHEPFCTPGPHKNRR